MDRKRILVADDIEIWRERHITDLTEFGYEPVVVDSGDRAEEMFMSGEIFYGAILDNNMPSGEGMKILQQARCGQYGEERMYMPILMVFSCANPDIINKLVERFGAKFLNKDTLEPEAYRETIRKLFGDPNV